ncbi:hypothetical protein Asp14428_15520 [Actinoplanes sp. NBRC 14428]|nr:hypothetical protein Asp14428_15520 [Actinoplanes sp. NBRC 14428]
MDRVVLGGELPGGLQRVGVETVDQVQVRTVPADRVLLDPREKDGTKTVARTPARCAAQATAAPWFPPEAAVTEAAPAGMVSTAFSAPRALKEPVYCNCSSFSVSSPRDPTSRPSTRTTGVCRTRPRRRSRAPARSPSAGITRRSG